MADALAIIVMVGSIFTVVLASFYLGRWTARSESEKTRIELKITEQHLLAFGGDGALVLVAVGKPPPEREAAIVMAEARYLERAGWVREELGPGWCPPWAPQQTWSQRKALERQRGRDSIPPHALLPSPDEAS